MGQFTKIFTIFMVIALTFVCSVKSSDDTKSKTDKKNEEFPEEDVDMLMEPNDYAPLGILQTQERNYRSREPSASLTSTTRFRQMLHPRLIQARRSSTIDSHTQAAQNYYPPFFREAPPLGHSRPYFPSPDGTLLAKYAEQRTAGNLGPQQRSLNYDQSILGSGDFGIIRGGTFYPEEELPYHTEDSLDFVQKYTYPEEQFAQFRDFADINTPVDSAFSQYVVIYENRKRNDNTNDDNQHDHDDDGDDDNDAVSNISNNNNNSTSNSSISKSNSITKSATISRKHPKNIFEQLQLLDRETAREKTLAEREEKQKKKKINTISKTKAKLAKTKLDLKKYNKKKTSTGEGVAGATGTTFNVGRNQRTTKNDIDDVEPLLALS